ncbi:MAG: hypothetical protein QOG62_306 [Thermoleophilaceae bacterium]|jgi:uncharacterized glyoxalase superfamily protein PhnB|nr:hypothetical protein [Thermoleophilaceae bacterium]
MADSPSIYPTLRFRDTPAAIRWLVDALGFEQGLVVPGENEGEIRHAELKLGNGMIMVGDDLHDQDPIAQPPGVAACYLVINDPDERYARAKEHGAEIVRELTDTDYGSRDFTVRDPEGNIWSFGTYDPFAPPA